MRKEEKKAAVCFVHWNRSMRLSEKQEESMKLYAQIPAGFSIAEDKRWGTIIAYSETFDALDEALKERKISRKIIRMSLAHPPDVLGLWLDKI